MIRVAIADDHHLVRSGIRALLEKTDDIEVVGEAKDGRSAIRIIQETNPDVLVMDINMPDLNGIKALEEIQSLKLQTHVVILSMYSDDLVVRQALQFGAKGFILKASVTEELLLAIHAAQWGGTYLSPSISDKMYDVLTVTSDSNQSNPGDFLTRREQELLKHISTGYTNKEIAEILHISVKTVERHRTNLMTKMNARNLVELIRMGVRYGLISLDE